MLGARRHPTRLGLGGRGNPPLPRFCNPGPEHYGAGLLEVVWEWHRPRLRPRDLRTEWNPGLAFCLLRPFCSEVTLGEILPLPCALVPFILKMERTTPT